MSLILPPAWTTIGPLTTIFTPPPDCAHLTISYPSIPTVTTSLDYTAPTRPPSLVFYNSFLAPSCFPSTATPKPQSLTTITSLYSTFTTIPTPTRGIYYPGRCPQDWSVYTQTYSASLIPTGYTVALCCPQYTAPPSPTVAPTSVLSKRRGKNSHKKHKISDCGLALPPATIGTTDTATNPSATPSSAPLTVFVNGTLTTLSFDEWLIEAGSSLAPTSIDVNGIMVMWKLGDFPDLDAAYSATATASWPFSTSTSVANGGGLHGSQLPNIGLIVGLSTAAFLVLLFLWLWWEGGFRRRRGLDGKTAALLKKVFAGGCAGCVARKEKAKTVDVDRVEIQRENGGVFVVPGSVVRWLRRKTFNAPAQAVGTEERRSEEGLLSVPKKQEAFSPSSEVPVAVPTIAIDDTPPPPYAPPTSSTQGASNFGGPSRPSVHAPSVTNREDTRGWNETVQERRKRELDAQREELVAAMKKGREERRAMREREGGA